MDQERRRLLWKARNRALRALRMEHPREYEKLLEVEWVRLGLEVDQDKRTRRMTDLTEEAVKPG